MTLIYIFPEDLVDQINTNRENSEIVSGVLSLEYFDNCTAPD